MPVQIKIDPIPKDLKTMKYPSDVADRLLNELEKYMKGDLSKALIKRLEETVEGWQHKPTFISVYSEPRNKANMQIVVKPTGQHTLQWVRIHEGTGPRTWTSQGQMVFPLYYTPKTTPSGSYGGPGKKFGPVVRTHTVHNHKIEPRKFSQFIADDYRSRFEIEVREIVTRVLR